MRPIARAPKLSHAQRALLKGSARGTLAMPKMDHWKGGRLFISADLIHGGDEGLGNAKINLDSGELKVLWGQ